MVDSERVGEGKEELRETRRDGEVRKECCFTLTTMAINLSHELGLPEVWNICFRPIYI